MRSRSLLVVIVILTAAALVAGYVLTHRETDNSIRGSGTIEATDVDLSFQIPGRVIFPLNDSPGNESTVTRTSWPSFTSPVCVSGM